MKVYFGSKKLEGPNIRGLVEQEVTESLNERFGIGTARMTRNAFLKLVMRIQDAAEFEAQRLFSAAADIAERSKAGSFRREEKWDIMRERHGFDNSDLGGTTQVYNGTGVARSGGINWVDLTPRWVRFKRYSHPQNANKFFKHRGRLVAQLRTPSNQAAWVTRFGGIKVTANQAVGRLKRRRKTEVERKWVIGDLTIKVFPNISASLLPMLASHRWSDHGNGEFENAFFRGVMREKLVGPVLRHRPLLQPITQFWMAFRIPRAIERAINRELKR